MKSINIDGQEFKYRIDDRTGDTIFYSGVTYSFQPPGYIIFICCFLFPLSAAHILFKSKWIEKRSKKIQVLKFVFLLPLNIENPKYSKEQIKQHILNGLATYKRQLEIEAGNII